MNITSPSEQFLIGIRENFNKFFFLFVMSVKAYISLVCVCGWVCAIYTDKIS